jgi:hypothetical protein
LTIWDQLFHRAVFPTPETIRTDTGIPGRPLIVEQAGERPHHLSVFAAQLVAPFRPMRDLSKPRSIRDGAGQPGRTSDRSPSDPRTPVKVIAPDGAEERILT